MVTGKEECLNSKLTSNGNDYVKDLLKNFQGESEFDIHISSKSNVYTSDGTEVNGLTSYRNGSKDIFIEINSNLAKSRISLGVARTILHEYIHVDMFRKMNSKQLLNLEELNFKLVYEHFENKNFETSQTQHEKQWRNFM